MTPLNEGTRLTSGASSITSDGGEANSIILAEQPGDDARAGTVSTQARERSINQRTLGSLRFGSKRHRRANTDHRTGTLREGPCPYERRTRLVTWPLLSQYVRLPAMRASSIAG